MSELTKKEMLQIEAYKMGNLMRIHTDLVALNITRWSVILFFGTEFFIWQSPSTLQHGIKIVVLLFSFAIMIFLCILLVKKQIMANMIFARMKTLETDLEFHWSMKLHDDYMKKHWGGIQEWLAFFLNIAFAGGLFLHCLIMLGNIIKDNVQ